MLSWTPPNQNRECRCKINDQWSPLTPRIELSILFFLSFFNDTYPSSGVAIYMYFPIRCGRDWWEKNNYAFFLLFFSLALSLHLCNGFFLFIYFYFTFWGEYCTVRSFVRFQSGGEEGRKEGRKFFSLSVFLPFSVLFLLFYSFCFILFVFLINIIPVAS